MNRVKRLYLICGLPGVGKTTVATALAPLVYASVITSERVIAELFRDTVNRGKDRDYSPAELEQGYEAIYRSVKEVLQREGRAIVEGSFRFQSQRSRVSAIAHDLHIPRTLIYVTCPEAVVRERLERRFSTSHHQFGYQAHLAVKAQFEEVESYDWLVDTSSDVHSKVSEIATAVKNVQ